MKLVAQWREIEAALPGDSKDAQLDLTLAGEKDAARAAALLGPANPVRSGRRIRFYTARAAAGLVPEAVGRLLTRLDAERLAGSLELVSTGDAPAPAPEIARQTLAGEWQRALAGLPEDWSDVYAELELDSTDYLEPAALKLAPLNPARFGAAPGFRFRSARRFGYGASPGMVQRCLERLDEAEITGELRLLRVLSDTHPVGTQGPVWYVGGKAV